MQTMRFAGILIFVLLSWKYLPGLKIDNSIKGWAPDNSQEISDYEKFIDHFGSDALVIMAIVPTENEYDSAINILQPQLTEISKLEAVKNIAPWPQPFIRLKSEPNENLLIYLVSFEQPTAIDPLRINILNKIDSVLAVLPYETHFAGSGVFLREINKQTQQSLQTHLSVGMILLLVSLIFILRSPKAIFLALMVSAGGVLSMLLTAGLFDIPLGMMHTVLPLLILFYGTSVSLHILFHQGNFRSVLIPTFLAGLTTCIGFSVFLWDDLPLLRDFSVLSLGGIMGTFLWAILLFFPKTVHTSISQKFVSIFHQVPILDIRIVWAIIGLVLLISIPGVQGLKADIYSLDAMPTDAKAVTDHLFIEEQVSPYFPVECVIDREKARLNEVKAWVDSAMTLDEIGGVITYYQFPLLINPQEFGYRSEENRNLSRITFLVNLIPNSQGQLLISKLKTLSDSFFDDYRPVITGYISLYLYGSLAHKLGNTFVQSLLLAFGLIFLIIGLYLKNIWLAAAAFIANGLPIFLIIGLMGWLGINLDMITVPIGCLMLGIVVDDTIHFMYWFNQSHELKTTFLRAGPGIFYTSILLILGFIILVGSPSPPVMYYGTLSVVAIFGALLSDLILLPALLLSLQKHHFIKPP